MDAHAKDNFITIFTEATHILLYILDGLQVTCHGEHKGTSMSIVIVLYDLGKTPSKSHICSLHAHISPNTFDP